MATSSIFHTRAGKYIAFPIARRYFTVEAHRVRTVVPANTMEPGDHGIDFIQGLVRVNGREFPVLDVKSRLGVAEHKPRPRGSVLVVEVGVRGSGLCIGLVADKLIEVLDVREREIRGNVVQLRSNGRPYGRPKMLLDLEHFVTKEELACLQTLSGSWIDASAG